MSMSYNDSSTFPTNIFFSPLLLPQWHRISGHNVIEVLVDGNDFLKSFIKTLNHEIVSDQDIEHKDFVESIMDAERTYGWSVLSFYDDEETPYRVLTPNLKEDWIKETITEVINGKVVERIKKIGCIFNWHDDIGNIYREECYFEDQFNENGEVRENKSYFVIWKKGNGRQKRYLHPDTVFALGDLDLGILTSAIAAHQVKSNIEIAATKPFFLHFVYGEECSNTQANKVKTQMGYVGPNAGFGAKKSVIDEIRLVQNADIPNSILALDKLSQGFANMTRLPLAFFLGERQAGGLGDTGDNSDESDVMKRKGEILKHFNDIIGDILQVELGIVLDTEIYEKMKEESDKKAEDLKNENEEIEISGEIENE